MTKERNLAIGREETLREKPHIAIAGASGRIGGRLIELLNQDFIISPLQHEKTVSPIDNQEVIEDFDITNRDSVRRTVETLAKNGILTVVNSTGVLTTDASEKERGDQDSPMYQVHVLGARYLAGACREYELDLLHLSTEYVFNGRKEFGQKYFENDQADQDINSNPTWYGLTKALGEREVILNHSVGYIILRISQVQTPAGGLFTATLSQLEKNELFTRANNQMASVLADETVSEAIAQIVNRALIPQPNDKALAPIYHISALDAYTPYEISLMLADAYGLGEKARRLIKPVTLEELVESGEQKVVRPKNSILDVSRFESEFPGILHPVEDEIRHFKNLYFSLSS